MFESDCDNTAAQNNAPKKTSKWLSTNEFNLNKFKLSVIHLRGVIIH